MRRKRVPYVKRVGQKFNMLTILRLTGKERAGGRSKTLCLVRCDCGVEKEVRIENVVNGQQTSCGCSRRKHENSAFRKLYTDYRGNARERGYSFNLSERQFEFLTSMACCYCGRRESMSREVYGHTYSYNGVDRMDNSKGYEINNVVSCCNVCNRAKNDMDFFEFWEWIENVCRFNERIEQGAVVLL